MTYNIQKIQIENKENSIVYCFSKKEIREINENLKQEENNSLVDFLKRTQKWRNTSSPNGHKRLK